MKKLFIAIWIAAAVSFAGLPARFDVGPQGLSLALGSAYAASTAPTPPPVTSSCAAGEVQLSVKISSTDSGCVTPDANGGVIITYLKMILKFLSGGVGLVVLLMLVIAAIQYITAAGQPEQVKHAKNRIQNALTALVLFLIAFAVLNLIIPGGIFS